MATKISPYVETDTFFKENQYNIKRISVEIDRDTLPRKSTSVPLKYLGLFSHYQ